VAVSTASALGISEEKNQQMGRWHSKVSKIYNNSYPHIENLKISAKGSPKFSLLSCNLKTRAVI
jgi:hypothetical protein